MYLVSAALIVAASATAVHAAPAKGQWSLRAMGGMDFPIGGALHGGVDAPVADLGALNPDLEGVPATLAIGERSNRRIYNNGFGGSLELGYAVSDGAEVFGGLRYQQAGRGSLQVGEALVPALDAALPVNGSFQRLQVWTGEIGYRQYFGTGGIQPYVAGRAGLSFTSRINADFTVPDAAIALNDVPFYKSSVSATLGGDIGVAVPVSEKVDFNLETGIRWTSGLRGDDSALNGLGLSSINNVGARWDIPVRAGLTFRF
jgi:hypothetical protein